MRKNNRLTSFEWNQFSNNEKNQGENRFSLGSQQPTMEERRRNQERARKELLMIFGEKGEKGHYILIILDSADRVLIEIWSLRNLLMPKTIITNFSQNADSPILMDCSFPIVLLCQQNIMCIFSCESCQMLRKVSFKTQIKFATLINCSTIFFATPSSEIWKGSIEANFNCRFKSFDILPPFAKPPILGLGKMNEGRTLLVTCADSVLTYSLEGYRLCKVYKLRTSLSSPIHTVEVFGMEAHRFAVFDLSGQSLVIFNIMEPREPECTFTFAPIEKTVGVCWSDDSLYSLTKDGIVSKWKLLENGRKQRESVWNFVLDNCRKITGAGDRKFVISTVSNVINVSCSDCSM